MAVQGPWALWQGDISTYIIGLDMIYNGFLFWGEGVNKIETRKEAENY